MRNPPSPIHKLDVDLSPEGKGRSAREDRQLPVTVAATRHHGTQVTRLEGKEEQEGHHKTEQTHGLRQGKSQDGIREELLLQGRVAGIADDEGAEHRANTSTRAGHTDSGSTSTDELGSGVNVPGGGGGLQGAGGGDCHGANQGLAPHL